MPVSRIERGRLTKTQYRELREQLDFRPDVRWQVFALGLLACTLSMGAFLATASGWGPYLVGVGLLSVAMFQAFAILHECGHGSFARSPGVNAVVGHVMSVICVTAYWPWVYIHRHHHRASVHREQDPTVVRLVQFREEGVPGLVRFAWRSWLPIAAALQQVVFASYPLHMLKEAVPKARILRALGSVGVVAAGGLTLMVAFPTIVLPAYVGYLALNELFNVPHHVDSELTDQVLPPWEQAGTARSCSYPLGFWLINLNFNLHVEHHVLPDLPWHRLPEAQRRLKTLLGDGYVEADGIGWLLEHRRKPMADVVNAVD